MQFHSKENNHHKQCDFRHTIGSLERGEKALALKTLISMVDALDITADMVLCDMTKNGYKVKSSVLTEKLEALSPSEREKTLQMVDIMLDGK